MSWSYVVTAKAQRDIKKLDHNVRRDLGVEVVASADASVQSLLSRLG